MSQLSPEQPGFVPGSGRGAAPPASSDGSSGPISSVLAASPTLVVPHLYEVPKGALRLLLRLLRDQADHQSADAAG